MSHEFDTTSAMEMRRRIGTKEISPVNITKRVLHKAEATQSSLNAFYRLPPEQALAAARVAEDAVMNGSPLGTLHGIPFSAKDLMAVKGVGYASGISRDGIQHRRRRCARGRTRQGRRRDSDWQDHDKRIRLQTGRRQSAHWHHP